MLKMRVCLSTLTIVLLAGVLISTHAADESMFAGQDLHLASGQMTVYADSEIPTGEHVLFFEDSFSMEIGGNHYTSDTAIVRINTVVSEFKGTSSIDYSAKVYLEGHVNVAQIRGAKTTGISQNFVENGQSLVARFLVTGQIYSTAQTQMVAPLSQLKEKDVYLNASIATRPVKVGPKIAYNAMVPRYAVGTEAASPQLATGDAQPEGETDFLEGEGTVKGDKPETGDKPAVTIATEPEFQYPVNISSLWETAPILESTATVEGNVATLIGRFYLWQKTDEEGGLLEFQADSAVMYYSGKQFGVEKTGGSEDVLASGALDSIYLRGNILMTEGTRTIRANEIYYNFRTKQGLMLQAEMRTFDEDRSIPVYVRADKLRKVAANLFAGSDVVVTTSEFHLPQISMTVSTMVLANTSDVNQIADEQAQQTFDAIMKNTRMKMGNTTLFKWPKLRTDFERPDVPLRRLSIGSDSRFGTRIQSQWYLSRILGLKEPEGVDSTLLVDYASKRGMAGGAIIDYTKEDYFGGMSGYMINDSGEDDLGRNSDRRNLKSGNELRGRFTARHRHYLPYNWQATFEVSYLSDENFLESYFRREFNTSKAQETLAHLKRIEDNWAVSVLAKGRINDFAAETEELPTGEFHLTGQSLWDHRLTLYSDSVLGRRRDLLAPNSASSFDESFYTFASSRNELDMPMLFRKIKFVPYVAGTYALDDLRGFTTDLNQNPDGPNKSQFLGEAGMRFSTMFWKDTKVDSEFWDLDGLRHTLTPHVELVAFDSDKDTILMRDMANFGLSQKWQTHRGPKENQRTVDWFRLDLDGTFVSDEAGSAQAPATPNSYGPAKFIWNNQSIPLLVRRNSSRFGVVRDSLNADYEWQVSDTTHILGDMAWDIKSGVVQQFDIGVTRYVFPDISYYVGNRYLRPVIINTDKGVQQGSNSLISAITYAMNSRYTATFAMEYNFDYGKTVKSELALIRRYHRLYYGLTFTLDKTLESSSVVFSIWPQGIKDLALGSRKYTDLSDRVMAD